MAQETMVIRSGGARGLVILQTRALMNLDPEVIRGRYTPTQNHRVTVKKLQVGAPPGAPNFIIAATPAWTGVKRKGSQGVDPAYTKGLARAVTYVKGVAGTYGKTAAERAAGKAHKPGLTTVGGLVFTHWQAALMGGK